MADQTLTPAEREEILQTIARLLPASVLDAWEEIHLTYTAVVDASTLVCTVVRIDDSTLRINPSYKVVRLLPELRAGMYQRGRGTWFTMRFMVEQSGQHRVEFDYDTEPEFDFKLQSGAYISDLAQFPRDAAFTPPWLRERLTARTP